MSDSQRQKKVSFCQICGAVRDEGYQGSHSDNRHRGPLTPPSCSGNFITVQLTSAGSLPDDIIIPPPNDHWRNT